MANVSEFLQQLLNARYGKDVRQSIHDSIRAINKQLEESDASALASAQVAKTAATEAKNAVDNIGTTVDNYIKNQSNVVTDDNFGEKANAYLAENGVTDINEDVSNFLFSTSDFTVKKTKNLEQSSFSNAYIKDNNAEIGDIFTNPTIEPHSWTLCATIPFDKKTTFIFNKSLSTYGEQKYCIFVDDENVIQNKVLMSDIVAGTEIVCDFSGTAYINIYPKDSCDVTVTIEKDIIPNKFMRDIREKNELTSTYIKATKKSSVANCGYDRNEGSYYIKSSGKITKFNTATTGAYSFSEPIKVSYGDIVECRLQGYLTNVALISRCEENIELTDSVIPLVVSENSEWTQLSYRIGFDGYICLCSNEADFTYQITHSDICTQIEQRLSNYEDSVGEKVNYIDLYNKVLFIGDSVTDGHVIDKTNAVSKVVRELSYPTRLQQLVPHLEIINNAHAGESVQGWNNNRFETEYANVCEGVDLCIIELGWNQTGDYAFPNTTEEVDSVMESDVLAFDNYGNYITENSPIGNYCQLVEKVKNATPNATIVLVCSCGWGTNSVRTYAIKKIAEWANVLCIDTTSYDFNDGGDSVHSTPYGYTKKATCILKELNNVFSQNKDYINLKMYALNSLLS